MSKKFWLAFLAGGCGVALIVGSKTCVAPMAGLELLGDLLAVIGSIAFAGYLIAIRSVSTLYPTIVVVGRTYSWSAFALSIAALLLKQGPPGNDIVSWAGILAMAVISQIWGHTAMNASLRWFPASTVAFSTLLEPVFAALLAVLIFAEGLSILTLCGSFLVLASLAAILRLQTDQVQHQIAIESNEL